jgi:hypothetical protein
MDIRIDDLQRRLSQLQQRLVTQTPPARAETFAIAAVGALVLGAVAVGAIVIGRRVIRRRRLTIIEEPVRQLPRPARQRASTDAN